jgi:hypothetical protein
VKTSNLLSIRELQVVVSEETIPRPLFCPLGKDSFCFIRSGGGLKSMAKPNTKEGADYLEYHSDRGHCSYFGCLSKGGVPFE